MSQAEEEHQQERENAQRPHQGGEDGKGEPDVCDEGHLRMEAGYAAAWTLMLEGQFEAAREYAVHIVGSVHSPWLLVQACWLAARCMLVTGGTRVEFDRLIATAATAEQACSSQGADAADCASLGSRFEGLCLDQALCFLSEGRTDTIEFTEMLKVSEERKGYRMQTVPAQPKFYGRRC
jgi:hypothetical protein